MTANVDLRSFQACGGIATASELSGLLVIARRAGRLSDGGVSPIVSSGCGVGQRADVVVREGGYLSSTA